jgi:hypothetical protein
MNAVLALAGVYNLVWAAFAVLRPAVSFSYSGLEQPGRPLDYPQLWQGIGMLVGVYGLGYLLAATNPVRHRSLVLIGFVSKLLAGSGAVFNVLSGQNRPDVLLPSALNDLVWWVPFALILRHAYRRDRERA